MKFKLTADQERKLEQFARSAYAQFFIELLRVRERHINTLFRAALPENFQEVKGRALEIDDLIEVLKIKEPSENR